MLMMWTFVPSVQAKAYLMNDVGGTINLPKSFEMTRWSDWDLKAKGANGAIMYKLWLSPYQSPITVASGRQFAEEYVRKLGDEGGGDVRVVSTELKTLGGRDTVMTEIRFKSSGGKGAAGVYIGAAVAGAGKVIHSRVIASARNAQGARKALEQSLVDFDLKAGPLDIETGAVSTPAGFEAMLPGGWRIPLEPELEDVLGISSKIWKSSLDKTDCFVGILPPVVGEPDLLFACAKSWEGHPVDEASFSDIEEAWRDLFFGKAGVGLPAGEPVEIGGRLGALFRPRDGENPIRLVVAPFEDSLMVMWFRGGSLTAKDADALMLKMVSTVKFSGADGGKPMIRPDRWVGHFVRHRPTHPFVLGPLALLIFGLGALFLRRGRKTPYEDFED
jgi:hypothetical protein